ncbi:uncharacterized protein LOC123308360 [Coccinella septempunctata]|uniref:uncharacterized protein LOC123308360 n=1 Tax=Coccinella septempunctata TaxID=41139 RepID=UPI001D07BA0A|nr:uncharacterized protein LOC123308360 [Coccinella septempunctata]
MVLSERLDVNRALDYFYRIWNNIIEECVPRCAHYKRSKMYPIWFTNDIRSNLREKERYRKLKNISGYFNDKYIEVRREVTKLIKIEKKKYINKLEQEVTSDINNFWNYIKNNRKNSNSDKFVYNGVEVTEEKTAESFATFFSSVYADKKASYNLLFDSDLDVTNNTFVLNSVGELDFAVALKKLKPKKSEGADGIPPYILKACGEWYISHSLENRTGMSNI